MHAAEEAVGYCHGRPVYVQVAGPGKSAIVQKAICTGYELRGICKGAGTRCKLHSPDGPTRGYSRDVQSGWTFCPTIAVCQHMDEEFLQTRLKLCGESIKQSGHTERCTVWPSTSTKCGRCFSLHHVSDLRSERGHAEYDAEYDATNAEPDGSRAAA